MALHVLISAVTGADDVVIGVVVPNRQLPELRDLVGPLAGVVPVRTRLGASCTMLETLVGVEAALSAGLAHQEVPVEVVLEDPDAVEAAFQVQLDASRHDPVDLRFPALTADRMAFRSRPPGCAVAWELAEDMASLRSRLVLDGRTFTARARRQAAPALLDILQRLPSGLHHPVGRFMAEWDAARGWALQAASAVPAVAADRPIPAVARRRSGWSGVAPRSPVEHTVLSIWRDVLLDDGLGIFDSFFDHGGSSTLAARAVLLVKRQLHVAIDVGVLFETPTAAGVAAEIERMRGAGR
jgi:Condensation domain/Phosphopantetheine attachment site